jgi:serine/threonine-protein kinase
LRCLEEDPRRRPASALRVAMALPGGNAVAAALAAGETPSPEMVAASQEKEGFRPGPAALCLAAVVLSVLGGLAIAERIGFLARAPLPLPPDALSFKAQELLADLGYTETPAAVAGAWICCDESAREAIEQSSASERDAMLASHRPAVIQYVYRQHQAGFTPGPVLYDSPPNSEPGMIRLRLDATGRLLELEVEPWAEDPESTSGVAPDRLARLFDAAGLDRSRFSATPPERLPPMMADSRMAWRGTYGDGSDEPIRVEAAFWQGRPVLFEVAGVVDAEPFAYVDTAFLFLLGQLGFLLLAGIVLLAWHKARGNRLDHRGALVLTAAMALLYVLSNLSDLYFLRGPNIELILFPLTVWVLYISIEPLARRHWPDSLISWTRFSRGRIRNTLVASHILAGVVLCEAFAFAFSSLGYLKNPIPERGAAQIALTGAIGEISDYLFWLAQGVLYAMVFLACVVLARLVVRKTWIADLLAVTFFNLQGLARLTEPSGEAVTAVATILLSLAHIWMMRRFGFLAVLTTFFFALPVVNTPLIASGWMAERSIALHVVPVVVAAWALWVIIRTQGKSNLELAGAG